MSPSVKWARLQTPRRLTVKTKNSCNRHRLVLLQGSLSLRCRRHPGCRWRSKYGHRRLRRKVLESREVEVRHLRGGRGPETVIWEITGLCTPQVGCKHNYYFPPLPPLGPPTFRPKHSEPTTHRVTMHLGVYWEWGLRGQAWVAHTFLVTLLGVASSYRRGDARAARHAGEM